MSSELTALIAAVALGALFAVNLVGNGVQDYADQMFKSVGEARYNDFSAKFVSAP